MRKKIEGIIKGIRYALEGYRTAFAEDEHFRINLFLSLLGVSLSFLFLKGCERLIVAFANYTVLIAELFNTSIENAVDTATEDFHPLAKSAKDIASAGVLTAGIFALLLDVLYLLPAMFSAFFKSS